MELKTIDIDALEWFDKINGNSYFAGIITLNYEMEGEKQLLIPFQYGYGNQYEYAALDVLEKSGYICNVNGMSISRLCRDNGIILRSNIRRNCLKRELINLSI